MNSKRIAAVVWSLATIACAAGAAPPREPSDADVDRAIDQAKRFLHAEQQKAGLWNRYSAAHWQGTTALACFALLEAGENPQEPNLAKGLDRLLEIDFDNLYLRAVRTMAYSLAVTQTKDSPYRAKLEQDVQWLTQGAIRQQGAWGYGGPERYGDNSCSQFALLALWEADRAGIDVSPGLIRLAERTWLTRQRSDGGWIYPGFFEVKGRNGSISATRLAVICRDV